MCNRDKSSARKHQSFQNGRTMQARRSNWCSGLFLCACPHNGNGRFGGDDAGGRASTTHAQLRPTCAFKLRTSRVPLEFRDVCRILSTLMILIKFKNKTVICQLCLKKKIIKITIKYSI